MRRDYSIEQFVEAMERVRDRLPDAVLATDVIVGFPGETEADFCLTLQLLERFQFLKVHLFPYSPRPRTSAARLDGHVPPETRTERMVRARELCQQLQQRGLESRIGDRVQVLIEKGSPRGSTMVAEGLSREGLRVLVESSSAIEIERGSEVEALLHQREGAAIRAHLQSESVLERVAP
jgi:tRNA A37 methylthiotransferase MiaB